jgi:hypothetical protein
MLKKALSLNRIANVFYIILEQTKQYNEKNTIMTNEEKIKQLKKIQSLIDISILVLDRKIKLMGISKEFVAEAKKIKNRQNKDKRNWYDYLNISSWFKE